MAIRSIINFSEAMNLAVGINVKLLPDDKLEIAYCVLKRANNTLSIVEKRAGIQHIEDLCSFLKAFIDKGVRIHLNCVGRAVLTKIIAGERPGDPSDKVRKSFPGIKKEDFVVQQFTGQNFLVLSLVRTDAMVKANLFLDQQLTSFSMGTVIAESIASVIPENSIVLEGYAIQFDGGQIKSAEVSDALPTAEFNIGGTSLPAQYLLAYASALSLFVPQNNLLVEGLPQYVNDAPGRYEAKRHIYKVAQWVVIALLLVLSVNAVVFFWLDGRVAEMEATVNFQRGQNKNSADNHNSIQRLTAAYDALGWEANRLPLFYADQLAAAVPVDIQLNTMEAGMLNESVLRRDRKHQFDATLIRVDGISNDPSILNEWIAKVKSLEWVGDVREQNYRFDQRLGKGFFEFTIVIRK